MVSNPEISAVMAVYNGEEFLHEAIESMLHQTYQDFELIIVDDASSDRSWEIVKSFAELDTRIHLVRNQINHGGGEARNIGISFSQGKFIANMDQDDVSLPERFEKQIMFFKNHADISILGGQAINIDQNGHHLSKQITLPLEPAEIRWGLFSKCPIVHSSVMMRSCIFKEFNYKYPGDSHTQDYGLWDKLNDHFRFANLPDTLVNYRLHPHCVSITQRNQQADRAYEIIRNRVRRMTMIELTDCQITGLRHSRRIYSLADAKIICLTIIRLCKNTMDWSNIHSENKKLRQMAAGKLRSIWKSQKKNVQLLPFILYSFWLDPGSLKYLDKKNR